MNYILFDEFATRKNMLPLTFTRPIAEVRFGMTTMREKWEDLLEAKTSTLTEDYLIPKFPIVEEDENILINSSFYPDKTMVDMIRKLKPGQAIIKDEIIIAMHVFKKEIEDTDQEREENETIEFNEEVLKLNFSWDIFSKNGIAIQRDFDRLTEGKKSAEVNSTNTLIGDNIFIEEGATVNASIINSTAGPVYIGKDAEVMEGSLIRGPFVLMDHSVVKMGAKIYGPTTVGPHSKVGGELNNVVIFGYSNKAHDGFLGNSVIGEWCNIGADTNSSNLKNTYDTVKMWNYAERRFIDSGLQFLGLIMGDHSKTAINTQLNTGTTIGVNVNLFGAGFPRTYLASFQWGGPAGFINYKLDKAFIVAEKVFARRGLEFDEKEKSVLTHIYDLTYPYRKQK